MASIHKRRNGDGSTSWDAMVRVVGYPPIGKSFRSKLAAELWVSRTEGARKGRTDLPPSSRTTVKVVESVIMENDGYENKQIQRSTDHRVSQAG